ncbi:hypothetical protein Caci_8672 [Catenulispora acidiphila DSM 44928]|uniref:Uncharacterized protein n=1 Tax=Catenulispora acidiphila (strain DSM 44928 / JCM 14897 / NBRC 102108 / NRRL B-24433 / ID139908) TaxID=479433 RepID=C7Q0F4_CATAD|nr:hypothetical protein Caci_8672 [Catenulispora acidiphila DSM 44928]
MWARALKRLAALSIPVRMLRPVWFFTMRFLPKRFRPMWFLPTRFLPRLAAG